MLAWILVLNAVGMLLAVLRNSGTAQIVAIVILVLYVAAIGWILAAQWLAHQSGVVRSDLSAACPDCCVNLRPSPIETAALGFYTRRRGRKPAHCWSRWSQLAAPVLTSAGP